MNSNSGMTKRQFKEGVIVSLKITLIFALLFTLINHVPMHRFFNVLMVINY